MRRRYFESKIENASLEEVSALQWELFSDQVAYTLSENRFYRAKYGSGVDISSLRGYEDLVRIPVTRKDEIVADVAMDPPYGTRLQVPRRQIVQVVETSGTTGKGAEVQALTASDLARVLRAEAFGFVWAGAKKGTVVGINMPVTMKAAGDWWLRTLHKLGCNVLRLGDLGSEERLLYLQRYGAEIVVTNAYYLRRLETVAREMGLRLPDDLPSVRSIFAGGGGWSVDWAQRARRTWNADLFEQYGSSQRAICWTCEEGTVQDGRPGVIHSLPHLCLIEVVNPSTGKHVGPWEEGEIVITPLGQRATPLLRYATNDYAVYVPPGACPCGRNFSGIAAGSVRRYDGVLRVKGQNLWPEAVERVVFKHDEISDFRGLVTYDGTSRECVEIRLEFAGSASVSRRAELRELISASLKDETGLRIDVLEAPANGATVRSGTFKISRWTDARQRVLFGNSAEASHV